MSRRAPLLLTLLLATCAGTSSDAQDIGPRKKPTMVDPGISWAKTTREAPPISLTATDGSGLILEAVEAHAVVNEPLAFTELHLTFRNPESRVREGRFEITLPEGAAISRFAMKIDDRWQEGEVLEKQAARRAYEDFLHRRQDPALMEKDAGNQFQARVFPIPANGVKELIVAYSHELESSDEAYTIPLAGLPALAHLSADVLVPAQKGPPRTLHFSQDGMKPEGDLGVSLRTGHAAVGLSGGGFSVARVEVNLSTKPDALDGLTVLFDTSGSRALGFERQVHDLGALMAALPATLPVRVLLFDQELHDGYEGPAGRFNATAERAILDRGALGASDLQFAIATAKQRGLYYHRLLIVSDGISTAGPREPAALISAISSLSPIGVRRVDALAVGGIQEPELLEQLTTVTNSTGVVLQGDVAPAEIARRLQQSAASGVTVEVPGSSWVWPETVDGLQPGDEFLVYAELPAGQNMQVKLKGASVVSQPSMSGGEVALIERAAAKAEIDRLSWQRGRSESVVEREELKKNILDLSTHFRVLSDFTALLVLETEADYARFGIDRRAMADILTVGPEGITTVSRALPPPPKTPVATTPVRREPMPEAKKAKSADRWDNDETANGDMAKGDGADDDEGQMAPEESVAGQDALKEEENAPADFAAGAPAPASASSPRLMRITDDEIVLSAPTPEPSVTEAPPPPPPPPPRPPRLQAAAPDGEPVPLEIVTGTRSSSRIRDVETQGDVPSTDSRRPAVAEASPWEGPFKEVMDEVIANRPELALAKALSWQRAEPGDVLALVALGEALEASHDWAGAARAYGTLIDLFPGRADLRRMAGERLERVALRASGDDGKRISDLTIDTYQDAVEQRPDHPSGHRMLAYALVRAGRYGEAFDVLTAGLTANWPRERFGEVDRILREDLALVARVWLAAEPKNEAEIQRRLKTAGVSPDMQPSTRFVLSWETDANDVDFHIYDARGGHAFYSARDLATGGNLYADITTGYGPECFTIPGVPKAYPYTLQANYYSRGPMGYGMGTLMVLEHDGKGGLKTDLRPFIIMKDQAFVDLGQVTRQGLK